MFEAKPVLVIFAAPNGSLKSTMTENSFQDFKEVKYINADVIAKERGLDAYAAAVEATRFRIEAILNKDSFEKHGCVFLIPNFDLD
jgi:predicted ABC-type ATPase